MTLRVRDLVGRKNQVVELELAVVDTPFEDNIDDLYTNPTKDPFCYLKIRGKDVDNSAVSKKYVMFLLIKYSYYYSRI